LDEDHPGSPQGGSGAGFRRGRSGQRSRGRGRNGSEIEGIPRRWRQALPRPAASRRIATGPAYVQRAVSSGALTFRASPNLKLTRDIACANSANTYWQNALAFAVHEPKPLATILAITAQTYCFWAGLLSGPAW